jgi:LPS-assembly protein
MRSLSVGAILYALLIVAVLCFGPLRNSAVAQPGIVVGFVVDDESLVNSSELGQQVSQYLEDQLALPVKMRSFAAEGQLYTWLVRYREVDVAWLSKAFLDTVPAGQLYSLARNREHSTDLYLGEFVSRQDANSTLRQRLRDVLTSMNETAAGRDALVQLDIDGFVAPPLWQSSVWDTTVQQTTAGGTYEAKKAAGKPSGPQKKAKQAVAKDAGSEIKEAVPTSSAPAQAMVPVVAIQEEIKRPDASSAEPDPAATDMPGALAPPLTQADEPEAESEQAIAVQGKGGQLAEETLSASVPAIPDVEAEVVEMAEPDVAAQPAGQEDQIELVADYLAYNAAEDSYEAKGDVVLRRAGVELKSEELLWQSATQDASATGAISLEDAGTSASGERLQYNMTTGQGQIQQGKVTVREGNFHLAGEEIEKRGHVDYFVKSGSFTTCDGEIPDWKFSAEEVDVTLGGYARAKNVFFHIKDVPVLYTPYLFFPVKTERESGLLAPWFGYSNNKGVRASMAWYQVIDRNLDATFYLDYLSEVALGKGLEYRYALANQNNGEARYYHVTGFDDVPDMYYLEWEHRGRLFEQWRLFADVEYADTQRLFDEFGEIAEVYNRDKTVSTIMLQRNWQKLNLVAHGRYIKDLEDEENDSALQRLPELSLNQARYRIGESPVYLGMESYATRFWRDEGEDGERLFLRPSVAAVFKPGSWLEIVPEASLHGRYYDTDETDTDEFTPEFNLTLATRLQKNFLFDFLGAEVLQHSVEPKMIYTYIPDENQDGLPVFDQLDRVEQRNDIEYVLVNRLIARSSTADGAKQYRELLNLRLSQSYDIDEARNNTSGEDQPFSDVSVELDLKPTRNISLDAESLIPVYGPTRFRTLKAGVAVKDGRGNVVDLDYNYKDKEFQNLATDYVRLRLDTSLFKPVYLRFEDRYDFRENRELERNLGLEYRSKCWSLFLTYKNRFQEDGDDDHEVMVNFVLAGLGPSQGFGL